MSHIVFTANCAWNIVNYRMAVVERCLELGHRVTVLAPADDHVARLKDAGCDFQEIRIDGKGLSPVEDSRLLIRFLVKLRQLNPDMIFGYTIKNNIYGALAARVLGVPYVPNVSGLGAAFFAGPLLRRLVVGLYRSAFRRVPAAFFQNRDDRALFLKEAILSPERALLLPGSGIDLARFTPSSPPGNAAPRFLLIGRMLWEKGIGEFVAAARELKAEWPEARFGLLGFTDVANPGAIQRQQIESWVAEGVVEYYGQTGDVRPFIQAADCIVLPTYYGEGTPRTLIEAAALGRPAITSDAPGCREIVLHGQTGFLVEPRSEASLIEAMRRFATLSPEERERMGRNAACHASENYDQTLVVNAYQRLFPATDVLLYDGQDARVTETVREGVAP